MTIHHLPTNFSFLIPVAALGDRVFDIAHSSFSWTLRNVLEDCSVLKGIWDVRKDSAGLLRDHGIYLGGMFDVQIAYCTLHIAYCILHFAYCKVDNMNPRRLKLAAAGEAFCEMSDAESGCF